MSKDGELAAGCVIFFIVLIILFAALCLSGAIWMLIWNYIICYFFAAVPALTFWQGMGIGILWNVFLNVLKTIFGKKSDYQVLNDLLKRNK